MLRIIRLSPSRYHRWNRQQQCAFADQPSCPRLTPQQLTPVEVEAIHGTPTLLADAGPENVNGAVDELIHSGLLHRVLARTEITYSNSLIESWWRVLKHQWLCLNTLDTVSAVEKLVRFYVHEHNTRLPHSAFQGQTPDEMYCQNGEHLPQQLEASRQQARQARAEANRKRDWEACELLAASRN